MLSNIYRYREVYVLFRCKSRHEPPASVGNAAELPALYSRERYYSKLALILTIYALMSFDCRAVLVDGHATCAK